ncbi:MAG TPA: kelch repeat-containing protein [Gemmatimonadales bacterium]|nr:kelch repeat-containing protein [Gemmatimonadales bacterium]
MAPPQLPAGGPFVVSSVSTVPAGASHAQAAGPQSSNSIVWVSLPAGSIPRVNAATIRDSHSGARIVVLVTDGGFDPVAVPAGASDTIFITTQGSAGADSATYSLLVPSASLPRIVRSVPPPHKRDVPLNVTIVVTFSEPMDSGSLMSAVTLNSGGATVTGSVVVPSQDSGILRAEFVPAGPLKSSQAYQLRVYPSARSRADRNLDSTYVADFTAVDSTPVDSTVVDSVPPPAPQFHLFVNLDARMVANPVLAGAVLPPIGVTYQGCAAGCDTTYTGNVTISLGAHPTSAVLGGTTTVRMVNGTATFSDLTLNLSGVYSLVANASGGVPDTSGAFQTCATDCWEWHTPMPTRRNVVGVGVVGGTLYAIGGLDSTEVPSAVVEAYDPIADAWTSKASLHIARYGFAVGVANGKVYVAGGMTASGPTETAESYDPSTDTWSMRASLPVPTAFPAGAVLNGQLYVVGGQTSDTTAVATVLAYDPVTDQWIGRAPLPAPLSLTGASVFDSTLYIFGGPGIHAATVQVYSPATDQWVSRTPTLRANVGGWYGGPLLPTTATASGLGIMVFGGSDGTTGYLQDPYAVGFVYDPVSNEFVADVWLTGNFPPAGFPPHAGLSTAGVVNGQVYAVGYQTWRFIPFAPSLGITRRASARRGSAH